MTREYAGTSMEDVASAASVSKQTVYKHFSDKQTLFREVALGSVGHIGSDFQAEIAAAAEATDVRAALQTLARSYVNAVVKPELLRRRQLVLREAGRFPDLARKYHDSGPRRTIGALAAAFARLADRGELVIDDLQVAATQFAFLVSASRSIRRCSAVSGADGAVATSMRWRMRALRSFLPPMGPSAPRSLGSCRASRWIGHWRRVSGTAGASHHGWPQPPGSCSPVSDC